MGACNKDSREAQSSIDNQWDLANRPYKYNTTYKRNLFYSIHKAGKWYQKGSLIRIP